MAAINTEILTHSTAEYLAKEHDFSAPNLVFYIQKAIDYHAGKDTDGFVTPEQADDIAVHAAMIVDDEASVLQAHPEFAPAYQRADEGQVRSARGRRNLDYFLHNGIEYMFDESKLSESEQLLMTDVPISQSLMRSKIVNANGFNARINYMYHDALDHIWLFDYVRKMGLADKYSDFFNTTGYPFDGFLLSRQAELISGVGFSARQYLANPGYYSTMALSKDTITEHMYTAADYESVAGAIRKVEQDPQLAVWAGFVIKGSTANILSQRRRYGAIKELVFGDSGLVQTGKIISLLDPRYLAFMIDTLDSLAADKVEYTLAQHEINLKVELALQRYIRHRQSLGSIVLGEVVDLSEIPPEIANRLFNNVGLSTSYY